METQVNSWDGNIIGWVPVLMEKIEINSERNFIAGSFNRFLYVYKVCNWEERRMLIEEALGGLMETIYQQFNEEQQRATKNLFIKLVKIMPDNRIVLRNIEHYELNGDEWDIAKKLAAINTKIVRVLTGPDNFEKIVEVDIHLLINNWKRLKTWIRLLPDCSNIQWGK
jgi:hypothetical protein